MYYWFRPPIHLCSSVDTERTLCGTRVTGLSPTVRPLPADADTTTYFDDRAADVCPTCERVERADLE